MDIKDFAKMLDGRQYMDEMTEDEEKTASENRFVVVFGYSDDNCELRGAVHDEIDCYDGGIIKAKGLPKPINAIWCPADKKCSWSYETDMPHEEFNIFDGDELFCVGIVIDIKAARLQMNERERLIELLYDWGNKENDGVRAESIADYLLENGVMVLPCKINDHVWFIKSAFSVLAKPLEARVIDIRGISIDRNILYESITLYNDLARRFTSNDIGTKVFLTKKEAEAALKEMESANNG